MSALGHIAVGVATARLITPPGSSPQVLPGRMLAFSVLSMLPDLDFLIPAGGSQGGPFTHRGASHSLVAAMIVGIAVALAIRASKPQRTMKWGLLVAAVVASHAILDLFGDTTLGVALLWPISDVRFLAPWHILPNPPWPGLFSSFGLRALGLELVWFLPLWLYAFFPRRLLERPVQR
jgi:inner membrane protein